jgi:hypothetical protein
MFKNFKNSFTLLEAIFSITILILTIVGAFTLVQLTLGFTPITQQKLIASYLVQEGIEIVRNIRDTNWISGLNWTNNLTTTTSYYLDSQSLQFPDLSCSSQYLYLDSNSYNCRSSGSQTKFQRQITLTEIGSDQLEVLVEVEWQEKGRTHTIKAMENLYNWRQ